MAFNYPEDPQPGDSYFEPDLSYIVLITFSLLFAIAAERQFRRYLNITIFGKTFLFLAAMIFSIIALKTNDVKKIGSHKQKLPSKFIGSIYCPIYLLQFFYSYHLKLSKESILAYILYGASLHMSAVVIVQFVQYLVGLDHLKTLILLLVLKSTQPDLMIQFLSLNNKYKQIINLLLGESMLSAMFIFPHAEYTMHIIKIGPPDKGGNLWYYVVGHIIGMFVGWFVAKVVALVMRHLVLNLEAILGIIGGSVLFVYVICIIVSINGFTAGVVFCLVLKSEKNIFLDLYDTHFQAMLNIIYQIVDGAVYYVACTLAFLLAFDINSIHHYLICYGIMGILRIACVTFITLILSKLFPFSLSNVFLHSLVLPTSTLSLLIAMEFFFESHDMGHFALAVCVFISGTSNLVNNLIGINLMRWTRLGYISQEGVDNMTKTLKVIKAHRNTKIREKKIERNLTQVNWSYVYAYTKLTLEYPYPQLKVPIDWEEKNNREYAETVTYCCEDCPNMQKTSYSVAYKAALQNQQKILINLMRTVIGRMASHCLIDHECENILKVSINLIESGNDQAVAIRNLLKPKTFYKCCKKLSGLLKSRRIYALPRKHLYRTFYNIRANGMYQTLNYMITIGIVYPNLFKIVFQRINDTMLGYGMCCAFLFCVFDCFVNIFAYSVWNLAGGTRTYFTSAWHIFDFISIFGVFFEIILIYQQVTYRYVTAWVFGMSCLKFVRVTRLVHSVSLLLPKFIFSPEFGTELRKLTAYQSALAMNECINEVLLYCKRWSNEVQDSVLLSLTHTLYRTKEDLEDIIVLLQCESPQATSSVKTKIILNAGRCAMNEKLYELKLQGSVDNYEYTYLKNLIHRQRTRTGSSAPPTNPTLLLLNHYLVSCTRTTADYLSNNAIVESWPAGHMLVEAGYRVKGVYVLLFGNLLIINRVRERSTKSFQYEEFENDYISPGNSFGEVELLTLSRYKYSLQCACECKTYFIENETFFNAMLLSLHPINSLEAKLWKFKMMRLAAEIIMHYSNYKYEDLWTIRKAIQHAFVPDLRCYKIFVFIDSISDLILIDGQVMDYYTKDIYKAPKYIPRSARKLILPRAKNYKCNDDEVCYVRTIKLLIVPARNIEPEVVLSHGETAAVMVDHDLENCPLHVNQIKRPIKLTEHKANLKSFQIDPELSASLLPHRNWTAKYSTDVKD